MSFIRIFIERISLYIFNGPNILFDNYDYNQDFAMDKSTKFIEWEAWCEWKKQKPRLLHQTRPGQVLQILPTVPNSASLEGGNND